MTQLDVDFVRSQFPAFSSPALAGQAFFENAGGSYTCEQVIDRLTRFYHDRKVQPYAPYAASMAGGAEMDEARTRLAAMMGVEPDELSFGPVDQCQHLCSCAGRADVAGGQRWRSGGDQSGP